MIMAQSLPEITHVYQNHHLDSTRWEHYKPREDDIIVATPYKCGTTWMQTIILHLIFQDLQPHSLDAFSPWLDMRLPPLDKIVNQLETQEHRRCIKSHLPLDGIPYFPQVKYVVVGRDARDVFMSMWNHYSNYMPAIYDGLNNSPGRVGNPFPNSPDDIREFWRGWISRGWFEWETEGYPFWSNLHHTQTWWNYRHLPNILFVHYNDLLRDLRSEIRRIADFLNIQLSEELLASIADAVKFSSMKQNAEQIVPFAHSIWQGGPQTFINKGTNGRWRDVLTEDDLKLYQAAVARELTTECANWLEKGRLAGGKLSA
jgi:aryl sulfotransferase